MANQQVALFVSVLLLLLLQTSSKTYSLDVIRTYQQGSRRFGLLPNFGSLVFIHLLNSVLLVIGIYILSFPGELLDVSAGGYISIKFGQAILALTHVILPVLETDVYNELFKFGIIPSSLFPAMGVGVSLTILAITQSTFLLLGLGFLVSLLGWVLFFRCLESDVERLPPSS